MNSVLILCTGNSCRSQMAQVIWQQLGGNNWRCQSAGSSPSGYVHPLAIKAIDELGYPTQGLESKALKCVELDEVDLAVTVCDNAKESCPVLPDNIKTLHWPFDDPADARGSDDEKMKVFVRVRDEISDKIRHYLENEHGQ